MAGGTSPLIIVVAECIYGTLLFRKIIFKYAGKNFSNVRLASVNILRLIKRPLIVINAQTLSSTDGFSFWVSKSPYQEMDFCRCVEVLILRKLRFYLNFFFVAVEIHLSRQGIVSGSFMCKYL